MDSRAEASERRDYPGKHCPICGHSWMRVQLQRPNRFGERAGCAGVSPDTRRTLAGHTP